MENVYKTRVEQIRSLMEKNRIDLYYIPMDDCHNGEYVGQHFKAIRFVSGFSGSAGKLVITKEEAFLWTDGRYFLQAGTQLAGTGIELMKMGEEGVPKITDYLNQQLMRGKVLGFEGRVISTGFAKELQGRIRYDLDLVSEIWNDRPEQIFTEIMDFSAYAGESVKEKLTRVRRLLGKETEQTYIHIINSLDDIAWLLNIRANDVESNPVAYGYVVLTADKAIFYHGANAVSDTLAAKLKDAGVELGAYKAIQENCVKLLEETLAAERNNTVLLLDTDRISYDMYQSFVDEGYEIVEVSNPTSELKAVKNETEIRNSKAAQLKDGVAMVKFIKWLKETVGTKELSECDICDKLLAFRQEQEGFIEPSFGTIAGYASNAAIIHYAPERGSDAQLKAEKMLLLDSGGHYWEGTTDTTRTIVLGEISEEEKKCFTLVAGSMLRLLNHNERKAANVFTGIECDLLARELIKDHGYNYNHGTGHGIGHVLNVHENPPVISTTRAASVAGKSFVPGMISSDEPGIYVDGEFGIRTENDILVVEKEDEEGRYLAFENMTLVPIDLKGIEKSYLTDEDIQNLNGYNTEVYQALAPLLDDECRTWLEKETQPI